jgi:predicted  nucleic acid-binding Zn-ribbon protein
MASRNKSVKGKSSSKKRGGGGGGGKKRASGRNPRSRGGGGKSKKPALQSSGLAQAAAEPEGSSDPKENSSKAMAKVMREITGASDIATLRKAVKGGRALLGKFKRERTRSKYGSQMDNLESIQRGLIKSAGGARNMRKLKKDIAATMRVLNKRAKQVGRKLKVRKANKGEISRFPKG